MMLYVGPSDACMHPDRNIKSNPKARRHESWVCLGYRFSTQCNTEVTIMCSCAWVGSQVDDPDPDPRCGKLKLVDDAVFRVVRSLRTTKTFAGCMLASSQWSRENSCPKLIHDLLAEMAMNSQFRLVEGIFHSHFHSPLSVEYKFRIHIQAIVFRSVAQCPLSLAPPICFTRDRQSYISWKRHVNNPSPRITRSGKLATRLTWTKCVQTWVVLLLGA